MRWLIAVGLLANVAAAEEHRDETGASAAGETAGSTDGELRLTGEELRERGVIDLAGALELIDELALRSGGRGDVRLDSRGGRQRALLLRIDGVPVASLWDGNVDLSSISATDIEEIRVSLDPAGPLDGPGGSAGVIDVITRGASGSSSAAYAQLVGSDAPSALAAATGIFPLGSAVGGRLSVSGRIDARDFDATLPDGTPGSLAQDGRGADLAARVERRDSSGFVRADVSLRTGRQLYAPVDESTAQVLVADGLTDLAADLVARRGAGGFTLDGELWLERATGTWLRYTDVTLAKLLDTETLEADGAGGRARVSHPFGAHATMSAGFSVVSEHAHDADLVVSGEGRETSFEGGVAVAWRPIARLSIDASAGAAGTFEAPSAFWSEAKLALRARLPKIDLAIVAARKGRLPTMRERFEPTFGNPDLAPEIAETLSIETTLRSLGPFVLSADAWVREIDGMIRFDGVHPTRENVGDGAIWGGDWRVSAKLVGALRAGATVSYLDAGQPSVDLGILENLSRWRADGWIDARLGARAGVWARLRWSDSRVNGGSTLPAWMDADAAAWLRVGPYRATLRVESLLDSRHEEFPGLRAPGRTFVLSLDAAWR